MDKKFSLSDRVGDIVSVFEGASNIFLKHRIDFCCGGNRSLEIAVKEQSLDGNEIVKELNESYIEFLKENKSYIDWAKENPVKLVEYIVNKHHSYLKNELPVISELLFKILRVHGVKHRELFGIHRSFNMLRIELEEHLVKEEEILFPLIREYGANRSELTRERILETIEELEAEHTGAGDIIKSLREATNHYIIPDGVCRTFETTYIKLMELEIDTFKHIHLENNILFRNI